MTRPRIGSASILIDLKDGAIKVYHGTDKVILAEKEQAEAGDWDKIWLAMEAIGIKSKYGSN
jgi:hypothetical protein